MNSTTSKIVRSRQTRLSLAWSCMLFAVCIVGLGACTSTSVTTTLHGKSELVLPTQRCGDFFIVDALIDGMGPYPMLLDTGAGTTVLSPLVVKATGISKRMDSVVIGGFSATGSIPCKTRKVEHLSRALGVHIEGIMAYGVFEGVLLTYDFAEGEIRLRSGGFTEEELAGPGVVNTSEGTRPFVRGATGDVDFTILVDTGSSGALALSKLKRFELETALIPTNGYMRINGLFIDKSARMKGHMTIGPIVLERPILKSAARVSTLGQKVLRHFELSFDQVAHRMRFKRVQGELGDVIQTPSIYGLGMVAAPRGDRLIVRRIFEGSAAQRSGLKEDDEIVFIDGESIADRGCKSPSLRSAATQTLQLIVERAGETMTMRVVTALLVE